MGEIRHRPVAGRPAYNLSISSFSLLLYFVGKDLSRSLVSGCIRTRNISPFQDPISEFPEIALESTRTPGSCIIVAIQSVIGSHLSIITRHLVSNMPGLFLRYNRCQEARAKIARDAEDVGGSDTESETSSVASGMHTNKCNLSEQSESNSPRGLPGRRCWQLA